MEPIDTTIDALMARYEVLLLDAYGVLVDTGGALPGAVALIDTLNRRGQPYFLLTNDASKLQTTAAERYRGFGLALSADRIITSGSLLESCFAERGLAGTACVVLGPPDSHRYVARAGGRIVALDAPFEVLVVGDESGFPFLETLDGLLGALFGKLDRGEAVTLLLPNPDLIYPKSPGSFGFAAGGIALLIEAALAQRYPGRPELRFVRLGKPHPALFQEARRRCGARRMVMIGDQLETDIRGARDFGIDSALVATGVAGPDRAFDSERLRPTYLLRSIAPNTLR